MKAREVPLGESLGNSPYPLRAERLSGGGANRGHPVINPGHRGIWPSPRHFGSSAVRIFNGKSPLWLQGNEGSSREDKTLGLAAPEARLGPDKHRGLRSTWSGVFFWEYCLQLNWS